MTRVFRAAARYLGAKRPEDAQALAPLLSRAQTALDGAAAPRETSRFLPVMISGDTFLLGALPALQSPQLCRLFRGATQCLAAAVTLGAETDRLIRRLLAVNPALGAGVNALASAQADEAMAALMERESQQLKPRGKMLSPRFSPGYGDVPLAYQRPLTQALECWRIGVRLTDGNLMLPEKSVTALAAVLALGRCPEPDGRACDRCPMTQCPYREETQ